MKEFSPFRLDAVNQCLWQSGDGTTEQRVPLTPKAFAILHYLVEHSGRLVTQDELLEALWRDIHVQPEVLKSHIRDIRAALGDDPKNPHFIETLPRRGYRFVATVSEGPREQRTSGDEAPVGFVGRKTELDRLQGILQKAWRGERQLVFVSGEAGIGKTALADDFLRQASTLQSGLLIARGQCVESYGGAEPYYAMLEALGQLCQGEHQNLLVEILASRAPTWLVQFPALVQRKQRESLHREIVGATRERMLRELADALEAITAEHPLLLLLEDSHWMDPSTVDLISVLARRRHSARLMFIVTYRPVDALLSNFPLKALKQDLLVRHLCHEIDLDPLMETEVAEYLSIRAEGATLPDGLASLIYRHSEGNPLFMVAVLTDMQDRGVIIVENGVWRLTAPLQTIDLAAPEGLRQMIEIQIDRLRAEQQRALEVMSAHRRISLSVAMGAAVVDLAPESMEEILEGLAKRHRMIRQAGFRSYPSLPSPSPCYEFVHALYRHTLYSRIGPARRRNLHRRIAETGEALNLHVAPGPELLTEWAFHFEEGGDWTRAVKYLLLGAETAGRRFEPQQAAAILEHARELANRMPDPGRAQNEIEILQKLGAIYSNNYDPRAVEVFETLAGKAAQNGLAELEARALLQGSVFLAMASTELYLKAVERARSALLGSGDSLERVAMRLFYLCNRMGAGEWAPGDMEVSRALIEKLRNGNNRHLFGEAQLWFAYTLRNFSKYREACRSADEGFALLLEGFEQNPYLNSSFRIREDIACTSLTLLGEWGEALVRVKGYVEVAEKNGGGLGSTIAGLERLAIMFQAMDYAGALQSLESALSALPPLPHLSNFCLLRLGWAEVGLGHPERALEHLLKRKEAMDRHPLMSDWCERMPLQQALADSWLCRGDLARARVEAEEFVRITQATEEHTYRALAFETSARVAMAGGDLPTAQDFIQKAAWEMEGYEVPLAAWRVYAAAWELYEQRGDRDASEKHRLLSRAVIMKLANSLPAEEPLREIFLSAPQICRILHGRETTTLRGAKVDPGSHDKKPREATKSGPEIAATA